MLPELVKAMTEADFFSSIKLPISALLERHAIDGSQQYRKI